MDGENVLRYCFDNQGNLDNHKFNQLAAKLSGKITACIRKYYLPGGDRDDLYQWGLLGLYKAVLYYDENDRYTFDFIASRNIQNMIKSAVTMSNRQKNKLVNEAESLYAKPIHMQENSVELIDRLVINNDAYDPQRILIDREFTETLFHYIKYYLSEYERRSVLLYMRGYKQQDIAEELNINTKVVDNAIQRAKKKIYQHVFQQNENYTIGMLS
ncbi:MAG: polymerase sporulation specific sigma factor SigH [Anaerosporomusa subterranea]|nr:polymerase sporulation specific sigma factor SigH [Anaerosporomusa subterranea]